MLFLGLIFFSNFRYQIEMNSQLLVSVFLLAFSLCVTPATISSHKVSLKKSLKNRSSSVRRLTNGKSTNAVEPPLLIGSFNIQTLGKKKFNNPDVIHTVEKVRNILVFSAILKLQRMFTRF